MARPRCHLIDTVTIIMMMRMTIMVMMTMMMRTMVMVMLTMLS